MDRLLDAVAAIARDIAERLPDGEPRRRAVAVHSRLHEPLRVAIAGRVSAGKSTLVNALLAQRVVPAGAGECTRIVTWLRHGHVDEAQAVMHDGPLLPVDLGPDRSLPRDVDLDPAAVDRLDVRLYNDALEEITIIDTPGRQSMTPGLGDAADRLLGLDAGRAAVADADALVYVVSDDLRADDEAAIEDFSSHAALAGATAANTVVAVTKTDRILLDGGEEALAAMLARWRARLGTCVAAVVPVSGLLAETALTGAIDEARAVVLGELAACDPARLDRWLVSSRRFLEHGAVPASRDTRAELLALLDLYGLRASAELGRAGARGASALTRKLGELSGITELRSLVATTFTARTSLLKADVALRALRALTVAPTTPPDAAAVIREALVTNGDRLVAVPESHRLRELELLRALALGQLELPSPLHAEVHRLATGVSFTQRLGLPPGASSADGGAAAIAAAQRWRRFQLDGRRTPDERRAARVVGLSLTRIARDLRADMEVT